MANGRPAPTIGDRLDQLARTPQLLVACDYDGTIAPIVDDPMKAAPAPRDLRRAPEPSPLSPRPTSPSSRAARCATSPPCRACPPRSTWSVPTARSSTSTSRSSSTPTSAIAGPDSPRRSSTSSPGTRGVVLEKKPASVAVHYRKVPDATVERVVHQVEGRRHPGWVRSRCATARRSVELLLVTHRQGAVPSRRSGGHRRCERGALPRRRHHRRGRLPHPQRARRRREGR